MILKGSQRGGANQLAAHLLKSENEQVEVHDLRGFVSDRLEPALREAYAVSQGTRCRQFLFSLSLNPPENESVSVEVFEDAISQVEQKPSLEDQPRAVIFHEKEGRRHAHAVWSRIDCDKMKAINLPHYKLKLRDVSRELYMEHGWQMPRGLMNSKERDPTNFDLAEWQQAKRSGHDPKALKEMFRECWAASDSRAAFDHAMRERGFTLARGDRRGHVALNFQGEVFSIARMAEIKTKDVRARLGDPREFPSVDDARAKIARRMTPAVKSLIADTRAEVRNNARPLLRERKQMTARHRDERRKLDNLHERRTAQEQQDRRARFATGLRGIWDRVTGRHRRIHERNRHETAEALQRDPVARQIAIHRRKPGKSALGRILLSYAKDTHPAPRSPSASA